MRARIEKWGDSLAVRLPVTLTAEIGLAAGQDVEIEIVGGSLRLRAAGAPRYTLSALAEEMGPETRPPFEDWGSAGNEWPEEDWNGVDPRDEGPDRS
jgi:antitoxin component of MazEF toxin-antitoxin module